MSELESNGTAIMDRPKQAGGYSALAPIGSAGSLKGLLESQKAGIQQMLPKHVTPERLMKTLLVAANRNPDIFKCTQASILETINRAAELGLDLSGTLGEAYPVPFNNKVKTPNGEQWLMQLQLIIGYRGMEKLAWQSGEIESIDAEVVCLNDDFKFRKGTEVNVEWCPCLTGDRGPKIGAYCCVKMKSGGKLARFLPASDIEKIRASSKSGNSPAWRNWEEEMWRKCAIKRTLKDAPLSTEKFVKAMEVDQADFDGVEVHEAATAGPGRTNALADRLKGRLVDPDSQIIPEDEDTTERDAQLAALAAQQAAEGSQVQQPTAVAEKVENESAENKNAVDPADDAKLGWSAFVSEMVDCGKEKGIGEKQVRDGIGRVALALKLKGKEWQMSAEYRKKIYEEIEAGKGHFQKL